MTTPHLAALCQCSARSTDLAVSAVFWGTPLAESAVLQALYCIVCGVDMRCHHVMLLLILVTSVNKVGCKELPGHSEQEK